MTRSIDVRTDEEIYEGLLDRALGRLPCNQWPGCECREQRVRAACLEKFGIFFDHE